MLESIAIVLILPWALGLVSPYSLGGLSHILLVLALIVIVLRVLQGRRVLCARRTRPPDLCRSGRENPKDLGQARMSSWSADSYLMVASRGMPIPMSVAPRADMTPAVR